MLEGETRARLERVQEAPRAAGALQGSASSPQKRCFGLFFFFSGHFHRAGDGAGGLEAQPEDADTNPGISVQRGGHEAKRSADP